MNSPRAKTLKPIANGSDPLAVRPLRLFGAFVATLLIVTTVTATGASAAAATWASISTPSSLTSSPGQAALPFADAVINGSGTLDGVTIRVTLGHNASTDTMAVPSPPAGISAIYDSSKGLLRLRGTASIADYEAALRAAQFTDSSNGTGTGTGTNIGSVAALVRLTLGTDTDGDGVLDVDETAAGTDPANAADYPDTDNDGTSDYQEGVSGTDPNRSDLRYDLSGRVVFDSDGDNQSSSTEDDVRGVRLNLHAAGPDGQLLTDDDVFVSSATTASPFNFTSLEAGSYHLKLDTTTLPDWITLADSSAVSQVVTVPASNGADINFMTVGRSVSGQLLDPSGAPIVGATVEIVDSSGQTTSMVTDVDSIYQATSSVVAGIAPGPVTVTVTGANTVPVTITATTDTAASSDLGSQAIQLDTAAAQSTASEAPTELAYTRGGFRLGLIGLLIATLGAGLVLVSRRVEEDLQLAVARTARPYKY